MATDATDSPPPPPIRKPRPFRRAVIRGLALILPPILTIVILLWMVGTVRVYVLEPVTQSAREALVWSLWDVPQPPSDSEPHKPEIELNSRTYVRLKSDEYIPAAIAKTLLAVPADRPLPDNARDLLPGNARDAYDQYVTARFLRPVIVVPVFLVVFVAVLYLLGKLFAAGLGGFFEPAFARLPVIRNVYSSVKKVTDLVFVEDEVEYKRVVAIEFPRAGVWSIGFVTGEGMRDIAGAAGGPCLTVAIPGSPTAFTGNVVTVPKGAAHDLNITIDEALQFFISCGIVVPARDLAEKSKTT